MNRTSWVSLGMQLASKENKLHPKLIVEKRPLIKVLAYILYTRVIKRVLLSGFFHLDNKRNLTVV